MRTPIYLAGGSTEVARVRLIAERLEATGLVTVVHRWWEQVAAQHERGLMDADLTDEEQVERAGGDLLGVDKAAIFWALWPTQPSLGCAVELGYALRRNDCDVIVSGPTVKRSIFTTLALCRSESDGEAFLAVMALVRPKPLPCFGAGERP